MSWAIAIYLIIGLILMALFDLATGSIGESRRKAIADGRSHGFAVFAAVAGCLLVITLWPYIFGGAFLHGARQARRS